MLSESSLQCVFTCRVPIVELVTLADLQKRAA
jgi:hypothetical protein